MDGRTMTAHAPIPAPPPVGLLVELTHRCPLACPYCSNPLALDPPAAELDTATWKRVFDDSAALGALHVHLTGGEPTARRDIVELTRHATAAGLYTNLITSGIGVSPKLYGALVEAGLDHLQLSLQGADAAVNDRFARYDGASSASSPSPPW
jgi:pyrroloquinoline quinone biosynthesis protein E